MAPVILEMDPPKDTGRPRANPRNMMDAIIFRIHTVFISLKSPSCFPITIELLTMFYRP